ncbi:unnamed protein product, partial [Effrenium voratum]
ELGCPHPGELGHLRGCCSADPQALPGAVGRPAALRAATAPGGRLRTHADLPLPAFWHAQLPPHVLRDEGGGCKGAVHRLLATPGVAGLGVLAAPHLPGDARATHPRPLPG